MNVGVMLWLDENLGWAIGNDGLSGIDVMRYFLDDGSGSLVQLGGCWSWSLLLMMVRMVNIGLSGVGNDDVIVDGK